MYVVRYEGRSFNVLTFGPPIHVVVRNMWKLWSLHNIVIFYNRRTFQSNTFSLSKVIERPSWFSYIQWLYHGMQN